MRCWGPVLAKLSKKKLFNVIETAIRDSGWRVARLSGANEFPARYVIGRDSARHRVRIYIWNITHGGGSKRAPDEYRIQITSGVTQFVPEADGKTLILGWSQETGSFAGWDLAHHSGPFGSSPSVQINRQALLDGAVRGFAVYRKETGELAVGFRPEFIATYIDQLGPLHATGKFAKEAALLDKVSADPAAVVDAEIDVTVATSRRYAVITTRRALREMDFRKRVLEAYGHHCAMCGVQLGLLDAAHVLPVECPGSTDETCNGVALCALHHRAYDRGLVTFDEKYQILVSEAQTADLKAIGHHGGMVAFRKGLATTIAVPSDKGLRPKAAYVTKANAARGWMP